MPDAGAIGDGETGAGLLRTGAGFAAGCAVAPAGAEGGAAWLLTTGASFATGCAVAADAGDDCRLFCWRSFATGSGAGALWWPTRALATGCTRGAGAGVIVAAGADAGGGDCGSAGGGVDSATGLLACELGEPAGPSVPRVSGAAESGELSGTGACAVGLVAATGGELGTGAGGAVTLGVVCLGIRMIPTMTAAATVPSATGNTQDLLAVLGSSTGAAGGATFAVCGAGVTGLPAPSAWAVLRTARSAACCAAYA